MSEGCVTPIPPTKTALVSPLQDMLTDEQTITNFDPSFVSTSRLYWKNRSFQKHDLMNVQFPKLPTGFTSIIAAVIAVVVIVDVVEFDNLISLNTGQGVFDSGSCFCGEGTQFSSMGIDKVS